jgi:hypothetical protein
VLVVSGSRATVLYGTVTVTRLIETKVRLDMTDEGDKADWVEDEKLEAGLLPMDVKVPMAEIVDCPDGSVEYWPGS